MKKRIASLLLALPLCLTLLPTTALAEDEAASDRTVIATVEDLQQFARAVDNCAFLRRTKCAQLLKKN